jgi:D-arabinose 1-dehydrogenase-like Zn-dependent alcohol dehydrogenase
MTMPIKAYAATAPRVSLEPFSYEPGELGPEEVEIKVTHCGICHSDLSMLDNEWGLSTYPFVPGHEAVGTIVALGESAKGLKIGQRVGVGWSAYSCLRCHECLTGDHHLCPESQGTIVGRYGGFADRLRVQWLWARPLPDSLDIAKAGPLLCGGVTVFSPLLQHNLSPTARVGVIGIGGLGHMALQFTNKWGYEVHAFTSSVPCGFTKSGLMNVPEAQRELMIQAYQNREAVEFLIQNVLTAVPLPSQIREQIIEDTLKGALAAKHAWPEKGMLEDISRAVRDICVPTLVLGGENDQVEKIEVLERALVPNISTVDQA